ncbi:MAG: hypothetical protein ACI9MC_001774 [Kiritimatiellia bacterium]|jgi:hypothetical protein
MGSVCGTLKRVIEPTNAPQGERGRDRSSVQQLGPRSSAQSPNKVEANSHNGVLETAPSTAKKNGPANR